MRNPEHAPDTAHGDAGAKLMLVALCIVWGMSWPLMRIALGEIPPFTMRTLSTLAGGAVLYGVCRFMGRSLFIPRGKPRLHLFVAALLNVASFSVFSTFAQLNAATSRVAILAYTMPIWSVVLAWIFLRERPTGTQPIAIALCAAGLAILIWPLTGSGVPLGIVLALLTGMTWAAGTVYLKWARVPADPMAIAIWQVVVSLVIIAVCMAIVERGVDLHSAHADGVIAMLLSGILGTGAAYGLWFSVITRLPAMTASLGVLGSPVIGVLASVMFLGERPTTTDIVGFVLILGASALTLLSRPASVEDAEHA